MTDRAREEAAGESRTVQGFYDAVKRYSYPAGRDVTVRIHDAGWDVYDPDAPTPPAEIAAGTEVARLREALAKVMPIRVHDGPDYAEVYFADGSSHSTQAMTMNPADWRAVQSAWEALSPAIAADAREGE